MEAGARVVIAIHKGDRQKMRKLPEKKYGKQQPGLPTDVGRGTCPANQSGHGAGNGPERGT